MFNVYKNKRAKSGQINASESPHSPTHTVPAQRQIRQPSLQRGKVSVISLAYRRYMYTITFHRIDFSPLFRETRLRWHNSCPLSSLRRLNSSISIRFRPLHKIAFGRSSTPKNTSNWMRSLALLQHLRRKIKENFTLLYTPLSTAIRLLFLSPPYRTH